MANVYLSGERRGPSSSGPAQSGNGPGIPVNPQAVPVLTPERWLFGGVRRAEWLGMNAAAPGQSHMPQGRPVEISDAPDKSWFCGFSPRRPPRPYESAHFFTRGGDFGHRPDGVIPVTRERARSVLERGDKG